MGLFQHKQTSKNTSTDEAIADEEHFFDEYFREELRNHGRWYFEKVINENGKLFKQDLDTAVTQVKVDLKEHLTAQLDETLTQVTTYLKEYVTTQLDGQFAEYTKAAKEAQDIALAAVNESAKSLQDQHEELGATLQKSISNQSLMMNSLFEENMSRMNVVKTTQEAALDALNASVKSLQEQQAQLEQTMKQNVEAQESALVTSFESNMAQVVEHYILGALGDQFDLKAQLPSIIQQMETNKQAIVDDMKL